MATTPILVITEVAGNQNQPEVTINNAVIALERAGNDVLAFTFTANARTISAAEFTRYAIFVGGNQAAAATLTVPLTKRLFLVRNTNATYQVTVRGATGTTTIVAPVSASMIYCDGTNCVGISAGNETFDTPHTWTAAQRGAIFALTDGATITPDFNEANHYSVTLGGNRTLANPTNITAGQAGQIVITQDGTGNRTLVYDGFWKWPGGSAPVLSTASGEVDILSYFVVSATFIAATMGHDFS